MELKDVKKKNGIFIVTRLLILNGIESHLSINYNFPTFIYVNPQWNWKLINWLDALFYAIGLLLILNGIESLFALNFLYFFFNMLILNGIERLLLIFVAVAIIVTC